MPCAADGMQGEAESGCGMTEAIALIDRLKSSLSGLDRLAACAGSARLSADLPESPSSAAALRGRALHLAWELMLRKKNPELEPQEMKLVNGIYEVTEEDVLDAQWAFFEVMKRKPEDHDAELLLEHRLNVEGLGLITYQREDGTWSNRLDAAWLVRSQRYAIIMEGKFGRKEVSHPKRNLQVKGQCVALFREFGLVSVEGNVFQPQAWNGNIKTQGFDIPDLELAEAEIRMYVRRSQSIEAPLSAGDHCYFCPAKHICPARQEKPTIPESMTLESYMAALPAEGRRRFYEQMLVFASWASEAADAIALLGKQLTIEGWAWQDVEANGKRVWADEKQATKDLKALLKTKGRKPEEILELISVPQAEKLLKGDKVAQAIIEGLAIKKPGKTNPTFLKKES